MLELKPNHKPVLNYFAELAEFEKHGHSNEMTVRNAFQNLLDYYSKKMQWQFIEEYPIKRKGRRDASVDGALLDQFSLARAFWEAKDTKDDLAFEVRKKFEDGYPQTNILFWQPGRAILVQNGRQILDEPITTPDKLVEVMLAFFNYDQPYIKEWEHAVEEFKNTIPVLAKSVLKILEEQRVKNRSFQESFARFMEMAKQSINPSLSVDAVEEMLIQHILTRRIFTTIFSSPGFVQKNAVARELEAVVATLVQGYGTTVEDFLLPLDRFYKALEMAASTTDDYAQKQTFLNVVYEKFFQGFAVKVADTHGIVYTPQPIVDFMVRSVEAALQKDFGKSLASEGVHILDPFVGTGNFILRVMREIHEKNPRALRQKYLNELHCNEVMLLPYYIACLNIEHLYLELTGQYEAFPGICLVDTFELVEDRQMGMFTSDNTDRVQRQKDAPIYVIIGNPPYNAGQVNENDNNKNRKYPAIDKRVQETYVKDSKATYRADLSDPYVKAFRMASDRVLSRGEGVVCYVTNSGFLDGIAFDGMRKHLRRDFDRISLIDLGGNVRKNPKLSGTTHNVFGIQVGVNITLMEHHAHKDESSVCYARMDEFWTRQQKYRELTRFSDVTHVKFNDVNDNAKNIWLTDGMADDWDELIPMGSKEGKKSNKGASELFHLYSCGIVTARDAWIIGFDQSNVATSTRRLIESYNGFAASSGYRAIDFANTKDQDIKWTDRVKEQAIKGKHISFDDAKFAQLAYRPFTRECVYYEPLLVHRQYRTRAIHGSSGVAKNVSIVVTNIGCSKPFHTIATDVLADYHLTGDSQCFPLYIYDEDGTNPRDNITDWGLEQFRTHYNAPSITKHDIFHYVYGILHDPAYRTKYAANLKRELPRIPFAKDFHKVADIGKRLMELHVGYEDQPEYPLSEVWTLPKGYRPEYGQVVTKVEQVPLVERYRVTKMKRNKKDPTQLIVNDFLTLTGIPANVDEYKLGNRSALDWIVDQYQISTDKRSGITNDPNREDDPMYIVRLIKKVVTVSVETIRQTEF
ncbi:MAG TPA: type ISP restriction/modification enzyme [Candidatus Didemnitutus sp.]|nr:type ISP restriction/modification enzyme [Candidatus Didemnitutus sp.]